MLLQGALAGLALGGIYAVIAVCLTVMAQLAKVINFAQAAIGMMGLYSSIWVLGSLKAPFWLAVVIGGLVGAALCALTGLIISRWLPDAPISARSAVTIAVFLILVSLSFIFFGTKPQSFRSILPGPAFEVAGVIVTKVTILMVALAIALAVTARLLLRRTSLGVRLRAISDRPQTADMLGVPVKALLLGVWATTGAVVSLVFFVVAPTQNSDAFSMSMLVIPGAAAALLGAFARYDLAVLGGLGLGMIQGAAAVVPELSLVRDWIPLFLIVVFLLWNQRKEVWDAAR